MGDVSEIGVTDRVWVSTYLLCDVLKNFFDFGVHVKVFVLLGVVFTGDCRFGFVVVKVAVVEVAVAGEASFA